MATTSTSDTLANVQATVWSTETMVRRLVEWKEELEDSDEEHEKDSQDHYIRVKQQAIIKALDRGLVDQRYLDISDPSESTFDWILSDDPAQGETPTPLANGDSELGTAEATSKRPSCGLRSWLISGDGIFHVLGKPGSGKSTLMKFICDDPRTMECLRAWAGPNQLVVSQFYFWRHGQIHQRKINGLRRMLLASVLSQMPEQIRSFFPALWDSLDEVSIRNRLELGVKAEVEVRITDREVRNAFDFLVSWASSDCNSGYRFCFFVDALDEFEEDTDYGYCDLASTLRMLVNYSANTIKVCVSSRELPAFQDQLTSVQQNQIHLQDLTASDMTVLAQRALYWDSFFARLEKAEPAQCRYLVDEFVYRAEGMFLWLKLVLPKVKRALMHRSSLNKLRSILLDTIPSELKDFFSEMQASIREEDQEEVYSILGLLRLELRSGKIGTFDLLSYSFLSEILASEDPDFVTNYQLTDPNLEELRLRLEDASVRLRGYCCGLVELRPDSTVRDIFPHLSGQAPNVSQHLAFAHWTIPKFLDQLLDPERKDRPYLQEQHVIRLAIQKLILRVKAIPFPELPDPCSISADTSPWKSMFDFMYGITIEMEVVLKAINEMKDKAYQEEFFGLLDILDEALCVRQPWISKNSEPHGMTSLDLDWTRLHPMSPITHDKRLKGRFPVISVLHMAVASGPSEYVWWRIDQRDGDKWLDYSPNRTEIFHTIANNTFPSSGFTLDGAPREAPGFVILEGLFDRGMSVYDYPVFKWLEYSPKRTEIFNTIANNTFPSSGNYHDSNEELDYCISSLWFDVIWNVLRLQPSEHQEDGAETAAAIRSLEGKKKPVEKDRDWDVFERFLRHGADPRVYFEELKSPDGDELGWHDQGYIYSDNEDFMTEDLGVVTLPITDFTTDFLPKQPDRKCCLRDFVEFMCPWNCEAILGLIDAKKEPEELGEAWENC